MFNNIILRGIREGDQNGGPHELSKILNSSLIACNGFNKNNLISKYLKWWKSKAIDTGPIFAGVFTHISNGIEPEKAVKKVDVSLNGNTAGCGPAHRVSPLAGFMNIPTDRLISIAKEEAKITHFHPDAGNGSAIVVMLCRYLLEGKTWEESKLLVSGNNLLKKPWQCINNAEIRPDGYIFNVLCSALHFLDNENSLENAKKFAGAANYCPVIVGLISKIRISKKLKLPSSK